MKIESKTNIKKLIKRRITLATGFLLATITILPFPWRARCAWARLLTYGRGVVFQYSDSETIHEFVGAQNREYKLGKQDSGLYSSIKQLELILAFMEEKNLSFEQLKSFFDFVEEENVSFELFESISKFIEEQNISFEQVKSYYALVEK